MPIFHAEELRVIAREVFQATGFPPAEADVIAEVMVKANLVGHDSHGVIHIPNYVGRIKRGEIVPGAPVEVVQETASTALLDGHHTLGHVAATRATRLALEKARQNGVSAVGVYNLNHIGRVGTYPAMLAEAGMASMLTCNTGGAGKRVVPFGGREARLPTNPIAMAAPTRRGWPLLLDMATSAVAAGKIRVAKNQQKPTGEGWIVDKHGNPTTNPEDFYEGGALLPLGGAQGHKGYSLAVMVEVFSGIIARAGTAALTRERLNNGTFIVAIDIETFLPKETFLDEVEQLITYLKSTPPAPGFAEVLVPGEYEARQEEKRRAQGIVIDPETWRQIQEVLREYKLEDKVPSGREG
ncbi:MAG: Ldh family oxidoreductase [Nitrospinota bacterium]|nr:MAG: Ldh family oxidoreductase [Nitrospinota bacterium]